MYQTVGLGAVPSGCLTAKEKEVARKMCEQTLPSVRGLGATEEERLIALDLANRFPGVHACDIQGMPECMATRFFSLQQDAGTKRLRTAERRDTATPEPVPLPEPGYGPPPGEERSYAGLAIGGLAAILVLGGGFVAYRTFRKKR